MQYQQQQHQYFESSSLSSSTSKVVGDTIRRQSLNSSLKSSPLSFLTETQSGNQVQGNNKYLRRTCLPDSSWQRQESSSPPPQKSTENQASIQQSEASLSGQQGNLTIGASIPEPPIDYEQQTTHEAPTSTVHKSLPRMSYNKFNHNSQYGLDFNSSASNTNNFSKSNNIFSNYLKPLPTTQVPLPATRINSKPQNNSSRNNNNIQQRPQTPSNIVVPNSKRDEYVWNQNLERATIAYQTYRTNPIVSPKPKASHDLPPCMLYSKLNYDPTYSLLKSKPGSRLNNKFDLVHGELDNFQRPAVVNASNSDDCKVSGKQQQQTMPKITTSLVNDSDESGTAFDYRRYIETLRTNNGNINPSSMHQ